jgi:hypothetical protein
MKINLLQGTNEMHKACSATIGKEGKPSLLAMLHSEHSPIRSLLFEIEVNIPTFISVHLVRHSSTGQLHYVQSMRDDRGGTGTEDRNTLVQHRMILNAQHIIDMSRKRLCNKSHKSTTKVWQNILKEIFKIMPEMKEVCKPQCEYRGNTCFELSSCGLHKHYTGK